MAIDVTHFTDPGCPWAWSASPALAVLRWRYGDQLRWRLVCIGLAETAERYERTGYSGERMAIGYRHFGDRFGMPFLIAPRTRVPATGRACRAIVATRLAAPEHELAAFRALQLRWFCSPALPDEDEQIAGALGRVDGLDAAAVVAALDDPAVEQTYQDDRALARSAAGSPTELQGKAAQTDGPVRFTAPSLQFTDSGGRMLEAGGFQPVEAYDVCLANLDPTLTRREPPEDPLQALAESPIALSTEEVAAVMTAGNDAPDRPAAEAALIGLVAAGRATREPVGDDALWAAA